MGDNAREGIFTGSNLTMAAAIIAIIILVFVIGKTLMNTGTNRVQKTVTALQDSDFTDFDQKVVTGTQVVSAYNTFSDSDVAVLIGTSQLIDSKGSGVSTGKGITDAYGDKNSRLQTADSQGGYLKKVYVFNNDSANGITGLDGKFKVDGAINNSVDCYLINYGSLLDTGAASSGSNGNKLLFREGQFYCQAGFTVENSVIQKNRIIKNFSKTGMLEYIAPTSRFNSYVVKDASGAYCGVVFIQISEKK